MYQYKKPVPTSNNWLYDIFSLGLSVYIAYVNTKNYKQNLYLNTHNAENTRKTVELLEEINNKIK